MIHRIGVNALGVRALCRSPTVIQEIILIVAEKHARGRDLFVKLLLTADVAVMGDLRNIGFQIIPVHRAQITAAGTPGVAQKHHRGHLSRRCGHGAVLRGGADMKTRHGIGIVGVHDGVGQMLLIGHQHLDCEIGEVKPLSRVHLQILRPEGIFNAVNVRVAVIAPLGGGVVEQAVFPGQIGDHVIQLEQRLAKGGVLQHFHKCGIVIRVAVREVPRRHVHRALRRGVGAAVRLSVQKAHGIPDRLGLDIGIILFRGNVAAVDDDHTAVLQHDHVARACRACGNAKRGHIGVGDLLIRLLRVQHGRGHRLCREGGGDQANAFFKFGSKAIVIRPVIGLVKRIKLRRVGEIVIRRVKRDAARGVLIQAELILPDAIFPYKRKAVAYQLSAIGEVRALCHTRARV